MSFNGILDFTALTDFDLNHFGHENIGMAGDPFNTTNLDLQSHGQSGPSSLDRPWYLQSPKDGTQIQPYQGVEVLGELDGLPHLRDPLTAPMTLYPRTLGGEYRSVFRPDTDIPATWIGTPKPNIVGHFLSSDRGYEPWGETPKQDSSGLAPNDPIPDAAAHGVPLPPPVLSSTGPERTVRRRKRREIYSPVEPTKKWNGLENGQHEDGWDAALVRFRAELQKIVFSGQPPGGSLPETALAAKIAKIAKEELKRSPLQETKAGEGTRPRNMEEYLLNILKELVPVLTMDQGGSKETDMKVDLLERAANALEAGLVAVNEGPTLRQAYGAPRSQVRKGARLEPTEERESKNRCERERREKERSHLERMSCLFKVASPEGTWTRVSVLSFAIVFLLWGPDAFTPGFVHARPEDVTR